MINSHLKPRKPKKYELLFALLFWVPRLLFGSICPVSFGRTSDQRRLNEHLLELELGDWEGGWGGVLKRAVMERKWGTC